VRAEWRGVEGLLKKRAVEALARAGGVDHSRGRPADPTKGIGRNKPRPS
jgi:hypothetical protein